MRDVDSNSSGDQDERLPVHPWTILVAVLGHRQFLLAFFLASTVLGLAVAFLLGGPVYKAQSVVMYRPENDSRGNDPTLTVQTQANMVLLDSNLEETRRRLDIPVSLKQLSSASQVATLPNTALIMIDVSWKSPQVAAKIANTLREVFVANEGAVRQSSAVLEVRDLRARIDELRSRLKATDEKLSQLTDQGGLVDLEKETQNYLIELTQAELLYDQARAEKQSIDMQLRGTRQLLEQSPQTSSAAPIGELNLRSARLRDTIHEDQTRRAARAELEGLRIIRDEKRSGFEQGVTPRSEYEKAEAAYQAQKEVAVDTDKVSEMRGKVSELDQGILSPDGSGVWQQKLNQLNLDRMAAEAKVAQFGQTVERLRTKISGLPKLQRNFLTLTRDSESTEIEMKSLLEKLGRAERAQMAKSSEFVTITPATPPAFPVSSRRTIIFLGITFFGCFLSLSAVLTKEILNGTIRSAGEFGVKIPIPLLGIVPRITGYKGLSKDPSERLPEPFRALALHVRRTVPKTGARLLFLSSRPDEGVTTVIQYLAETLRHDQLNVLVRNAQGSGDSTGSGDYDFVFLDGPPILESIDSEIVAPSCDAVVLVVASGVTPTSDITEAISRIRNTRVPIAGAVLNRVEAVYL